MMTGTASVSDLINLKITGLLRLVGGTSGTALYMARTGEGISKISVANAMPYETTLLPVPNLSFGGITFATTPWPTLIVPQWLPTAPDWSLGAATDGSVAGAILAFGGASSSLLAGAAGEGSLANARLFSGADYSAPRAMRGLAPASASGALVSAVADGRMLMAIPPATAGLPTAPIKVIPARSGVMFQDPSNASTWWAVYRENTGPAADLSPWGAAQGGISLVSFDASLNSAGYPLPIVTDPVVAEFDVDFGNSVYCLLAATASTPTLLLFDATGAISPMDFPATGLGAGNRIASPSVLALSSPAPAFLFAFIEMAEEVAVGIRLGAVTLASASA